MSCCSVHISIFFPIVRRWFFVCLSLPCWWHIKTRFVPKLAVPKRKQHDRVRSKVNLAPSFVRMKTKVCSAQNSISLVRSGRNKNRKCVNLELNINMLHCSKFQMLKKYLYGSHHYLAVVPEEMGGHTKHCYEIKPNPYSIVFLYRCLSQIIHNDYTTSLYSSVLE